MHASNVGACLGLGSQFAAHVPPRFSHAGIAKHAGVQSMLVANGVVALGGEWEQKAGVSPGFASLDEALAWCEKHFTEV